MQLPGGRQTRRGSVGLGGSAADGAHAGEQSQRAGFSVCVLSSPRWPAALDVYTRVLTHHPALYTRAHSPSCPIHACSLTILPYTRVLTHHPALYTCAHSPSCPIPVGSKAAAEVEQEEGLLQDPEHQPQCLSGRHQEGLQEEGHDSPPWYVNMHMCV